MRGCVCDRLVYKHFAAVLQWWAHGWVCLCVSVCESCECHSPIYMSWQTEASLTWSCSSCTTSTYNLDAKGCPTACCSSSVPLLAHDHALVWCAYRLTIYLIVTSYFERTGVGTILNIVLIMAYSVWQYNIDVLFLRNNSGTEQPFLFWRKNSIIGICQWF